MWLEAQEKESGSPELRRLRSAVAVLTQKRKPHPNDFRRLCSEWGVKRWAGRDLKVGKQKPLPTMKAELRQTVLAEGIRLGAGVFAMQLGGSGSSETGEEISGAKPC